MIRMSHHCQRIIWYCYELKYAHFLRVIHLQPFKRDVYLTRFLRSSFLHIGICNVLLFVVVTQKDKESSRYRLLLLLYVVPQKSRKQNFYIFFQDLLCIVASL